MEGPLYIFGKYMAFSKEFIIKYQNYNLDLDMKLEAYPNQITISTDTEKKEMKLGNNIIKFTDLKNIYVEIDEEEFRKCIESRDQYYYINFILKIAYQNKTESFIFSIEAKEEIEKLFSYFVFSSEVNEEKYYDSTYLPIHTEPFQIQYSPCQYSEFDRLNYGDKDAIKHNGKIYYKMHCIPIKYYEFYEKKSYLLIQNQDINSNYIDVWIDAEEIEKSDVKNRLKRFKSNMMFLGIIILIVNFISAIPILVEFLETGRLDIIGSIGIVFFTFIGYTLVKK